MIRVEDAVLRTIAYVGGLTVSEVSLGSRLDALGLDSVAMTALRLVLEAELEVTMADQEAEALMTAETVNCVVGLMGDLIRKQSG